jgi:hypothetical protein
MMVGLAEFIPTLVAFSITMLSKPTRTILAVVPTVTAFVGCSKRGSIFKRRSDQVRAFKLEMGVYCLDILLNTQSPVELAFRDVF